MSSESYFSTPHHLLTRSPTLFSRLLTPYCLVDSTVNSSSASGALAANAGMIILAWIHVRIVSATIVVTVFTFVNVTNVVALNVTNVVTVTVTTDCDCDDYLRLN